MEGETANDGGDKGKVLIRHAGEEDATAIARLAWQLLNWERNLYPGMGSPTRWAGEAREIRRQMRFTTTRFLVAEHEGKIVGYVKAVIHRTDDGRGGLRALLSPRRIVRRWLDLLLRRPRPTIHGSGGQIAGLFVQNEDRRRGTGRRLAHAAEAWLHDHGMATNHLTVLSSNASGRAFWEACGYRPLFVGLHKPLSDSLPTTHDRVDR
jgi:GNAT superfamily N-acetyltransferase